MNNSWFRNKNYPLLQLVNGWYLNTPTRSLEIAYEAALRIKAIEDDHFHGNKIDSTSASYSSSVMDYFQADLQKQLKTIRTRLKIFNTSRTLLRASPQNYVDQDVQTDEQINPTLGKLNFIDEVISKYSLPEELIKTGQLLTQNSSIVPETTGKIYQKLQENTSQAQERSKANTMGVLPRSIFNTINRLQVELDPNAEQDMVKKFRKSQQRTIISVRFILLMIIVPILTHQIAKAFLFGPLIDKSKMLERLQHPDEVDFS
ncbi:Membrane protein PxcA, involved in light-induced proton extrusion [Richelia intracellularis]|nr:Membrane protein PxcA, involved in light-induced proton extrusion [Richelia intracellularis]